MPIFAPEVVDAVLRHMNGDHVDDNLLIARAFADPAAIAASMTGLDEQGGIWRYSAGGAEQDLRLPWSTEIAERSEIRREIVVLYDTACERLGVEPRPH